MRELLLLVSIVLGQLAPNSHLLVQMDQKLRVTPKAATSMEGATLPGGWHPLVASPTKTVLEDYTASAQAVYSIDLESNEVLTSKDLGDHLQIASLTKLMTAYIILKEEKNLDKVFTVPALEPQVGDSVIYLTTGDELTVSDLLRGLLIPSGSDAAQTLAANNAGSLPAFVAKMNTVATELNLTNTHFANPVGWDDSANYSSAKDVTELARILLRNKTFAEIVKTKSTAVYSTTGRKFNLETTNQLLYSPGYEGVKTGYTLGAGECLVSLYVDGNTQVLTTVLGSSNRFGETDGIKGWILGHFSW